MININAIYILFIIALAYFGWLYKILDSRTVSLLETNDSLFSELSEVKRSEEELSITYYNQQLAFVKELAILKDTKTNKRRKKITISSDGGRDIVVSDKEDINSAT